ncbi:hypothetical protein GCM10027425_04160 [Alteromonas gracilis]
MDKTTIIRTGAAAGVAALGLTIGGISLASADDAASTTASSSATAGTDDAERGPGGPGRGPGMDAAALAEALGVDEAKVTAALEAVHDDLHAQREDAEADGERTPPTEAEREAMQQQMVTALAEELGVDEAKVTAALEEARSAHEAEHRTELSDRLDEAVTAGDLTAADKASVLKAFDAGVLGGPGGGPGMGGPGGLGG